MAARGKNHVNINLIIKDDLEENFSGQFLSWALTYGRYIIIITQIIVLSVFFLRFKLDRDHTDLKERVSNKQAIVESISDFETDARKLQSKLALIKQINTGQDAQLKILRFFQENIPIDTKFSSIDLTNERLTLSATAGSLRSFSFFLRKIQLDKKFNEVNLDDIVRSPDGRIEFKIHAKLNLKEFI